MKTDANVFVFQLNGAGTDILGALIMKWIAWIRFFDFEIKQVPGKKHTTADSLSKRKATPDMIKKEAEEENIDDFIDA